MSRDNNFQPNWASTPGDTIADILNDRQLSLGLFAQRMETTVEQVTDLIHGSISINEEIAFKLEKTLGSTAQFWMRRESKYRESINRLKIVEGEKWLKEMPIADMVKMSWIERSKDMVDECLKYFNVPDVWAWRNKYAQVVSLTAFRKSEKIESFPGATSTWLRQGEIISRKVDCKPWQAAKFRASLPLIRQLIKKKKTSDFLPELRKICADCGVCVVIAKTPSGCTASGATMFLNPEKAVILLSFRYLTEDQFWFTFFHEAGHLLLHNKETLFIEEGNNSGKRQKEEIEANEFSSEILIPKQLHAQLKEMSIDKRSLMDFSKKADISLGIVVGQLQHLGRIQFKAFNQYKRKYNWDDIRKA